MDPLEKRENLAKLGHLDQLDQQDHEVRVENEDLVDPLGQEDSLVVLDHRAPKVHKENVAALVPLDQQVI